jgi:hypothetical protein
MSNSELQKFYNNTLKPHHNAASTPPVLSAAIKAGSSLEVLRQRARACSASFTQSKHQHVREQRSSQQMQRPQR